MKKRILFVAAIAAAVFTTENVNAQDMKPDAGAKNIEVNFTPLGGSPISINNLRLRYFKSSDMAFRVGLNVSSSSTTDVNLGGGTDGTGELEDKSSEFGFGINLGFEKHWEGTDRLSPYWGAEVGFSSLSTTETAQVNDGTGATVEGETTGGSTTFGLNLLLGADFYFSPKIYLGTEVGFGFASTSEGDTETSNGGAANPTDGAAGTTAPGGSSFNLGPNFNSAIRLGFIF